MGSVFTCKLNPCCGDSRDCTPPAQYYEEPMGIDPTDADRLQAELDAANEELGKVIMACPPGMRSMPIHQRVAELRRRAEAAALAPAPQAAVWTEERLREEAKRRGWYIRENTSVPDLTTGGWKHPFSVTASSRELLEFLATHYAAPLSGK